MIPTIDYNMIVFKEGEDYVAYSPRLDVSSCGDSIEHARKMLNEAVRLYLEEAEKMGTLETILEEAGYTRDERDGWLLSELIATEVVSLN